MCVKLRGQDLRVALLKDSFNHGLLFQNKKSIAWLHYYFSEFIAASSRCAFFAQFFIRIPINTCADPSIERSNIFSLFEFVPGKTFLRIEDDIRVKVCLKFMQYI